MLGNLLSRCGFSDGVTGLHGSVDQCLFLIQKIEERGGGMKRERKKEGGEQDHKGGGAPKNRCFWSVVLEKTLESPWDCKEIKPVNPRRNQSWIFIGRTDAETEAPILWLPDGKSWLFRKNPDAGKDGRQEEKGTKKNRIVGRHHRLKGHESEQALGVGEGQGSLACCSPWDRRVGHDWTTA